ncbi:hypothetical protein QTO34_010617, partial [Cnephaeus nilssonii]
MSKTQKKNLTKFILETGENWTNLLPFTLLWARCTPYQKGFPLRLVREKLKAGIHNHSLTQALQYTQRATHKLVRDALPVPTADPVHPFQPRDSVWVKKFTAKDSPQPEKDTTLTPTAIKIDGVQTWLHHSQLLHQETAWILATTPQCKAQGNSKVISRNPPGFIYSLFQTQIPVVTLKTYEKSHFNPPQFLLCKGQWLRHRILAIEAHLTHSKMAPRLAAALGDGGQGASPVLQLQVLAPRTA